MSVDFEQRSPDDPLVVRLYAEFIRETDTELGLDVVESEIAAGPPPDLKAPNGVMLVAFREREPAAIGGVRHLDTEVAEVKSMYVVPAHRQAGLAVAVLRRLEAIARDRGCLATRLDTSDYLTPAVALYRSAGYREVPDYNGNPKANLWFERRSNVQD
ncbi:MAG TPA: GNAT family N-acetyltransferase [Solirubrobacterales bacterium]